MENIGKQYRGADKNQPMRTVTTRGGHQSFTDHVCEAGYHSHGNRKCHPVTEKHNNKTIQDMGGEWAYRVQHPSIQFNTPATNRNTMMEQYGQTAMTKMLNTPEVILMKQGFYDPCPGENIHGHPGYKGCHNKNQKHKRPVRDALGGWDNYVAWHPFEANRRNPDEAGQASEEATATKSPRKRKATRRAKPAAKGGYARARGPKNQESVAPVERAPEPTPAAAAPEDSSATEVKKPPSGYKVSKKSSEELFAGIASNPVAQSLPYYKEELMEAAKSGWEFTPGSLKIPQPTKSSAIRRGDEGMIFDAQDPRMKFSSLNAKRKYLEGLVHKNWKDVEFNNELLEDNNPYMLASPEPLMTYTAVTDGGEARKTMYAGQFRAEEEIEKWNGVLNYSKSMGQFRKDALEKVTTSHTGSTDWKMGMMMLFFNQTGLRIGSEASVEKFKTYGISTIRPRHISVRGNNVSLDFVGKKKTENTIDFKLPKRIASELNEYLGSLDDQETTIWGVTDSKNIHQRDYPWNQYFTNYAKANYGMTSHRIRALDKTSKVIEEYNGQGIQKKFEDRRQREEAMMAIIRKIGKEHGSDSAQSVVKSYIPFEAVDKMVDGRSSNAEQYIKAHIKVMNDEKKALAQLRKKGGGTRQRRRR